MLFDNRGYDRTSTRAIAQEAGVGVGTVFSHFPDKPSLLIAALLDDLAETQATALRKFPAEAPVCEQFLHLSRHFYAYYAKRPDLSRTLLKEMWFARGKWGRELVAQADQFILFIESILDQARQKGEIRSQTDTRLCAHAFFSHYLNVLFAGLSWPAIDVDEMIDSLKALLNQLMVGVGSST
jgi:AcrR family transcriptional regulator